ncbi:FAD-dependent oxidoreductase [Gammaproteobacteria bacterium]|jgi:3-phenylpropionate/trans-cinnamate dioxygenase ferredoxin reductase subunit|nr:FAD-dependent oxidoreductase [Gammaproteobacteria bacterium]MDC0885400.1 FAD-dependent oxidoreductase [Gammaproteobacteria bacterium]
MSKVLIVGGGHAGANTAFALRKDGFDGDITIISDESYLPYHRPPLSKDFLKQNIAIEKLSFKSSNFYEEQKILINLDTHIDSIDLESNLAVTKDTSFNFDYLVFATGASPRLLPMENADSKNLFYLRQIADVLSMHQQISADKEMILIGGGYIGLEVASAMIELGLKVTILEAEERILQRVTSPEVSKFYNDFHSKKGVRIICNAKVTNLNAENQMINSVSLESGESLAADIVLVGIGAIPNTQLADSIGLECSNGIKTDQYCRTSIPNILALGDCTSSFNTLFNREFRLESVPNALAQSKVASSSIVGNDLFNSEMPWFWSDQYDLKLQMAGLSSGYDECHIIGDIDSAEFVACYGKEGHLIAVDSVNQSKQFMLFKKALGNGFKLEMSLIKDKNFQPESIFSGSN